MRLRVSARVIAGTFALVGLSATPMAGDQPSAKPEQNKRIPDLVAALKATPGCLGVETATTASRKQVIFSWFEDKKAVLRWYHSEAHQQVMKQFFPDRTYNKPLKDVPEASGPILAIASITFADKPRFKETPLPISQISIELYQPMSGGIFLGGRFAPEGLKVPKMRDYTPKENNLKSNPGPVEKP
jgi:quinol monooxygenase YgiN